MRPGEHTTLTPYAVIWLGWTCADLKQLWWAHGALAVSYPECRTSPTRHPILQFLHPFCLFKLHVSEILMSIGEWLKNVPLRLSSRPLMLITYSSHSSLHLLLPTEKQFIWPKLRAVPPNVINKVIFKAFDSMTCEQHIVPDSTLVFITSSLMGFWHRIQYQMQNFFLWSQPQI